MLVLPNKLDGEEYRSGTKAKRLQELVQAGFQVPPFVIVPAQVISGLLEENTVILDDQNLEDLKREIKATLPAASYAVRSAAMVEDGETSSFAGQFETRLRIKEDQLIQAISGVVADAQKKVGKDSEFSIIVQEYIEPDWAGVIFTRDPLGGREMVLEYTKGSGERVVSGEASSQVKFLFGHKAPQKPLPKCIPELAEIAHKIEEKYDWPQDVEWAIKGDQIFILQTRPVTSLSEGKWHGLKFFEEKFQPPTDFLYEKTAICESFPKPKPLALSILRRLYSEAGPIHRVYQDLGIKYQPKDFLIQIGNELFVDKEAETQTLFPVLGYFKNKNNEPAVVGYSGFVTTFLNTIRFSTLSLRPLAALQARLATEFSAYNTNPQNIKEVWENFEKIYPLIFEINLRSQKSVAKLESVLRQNIGRLALLISSNNLVGNKIPAVVAELVGSPVGNSVSLDDTSLFLISDSAEKSGIEVQAWLDSLPVWKRNGLLPYIKSAQNYLALREQSRWLSVLLMNSVRNSVEATGRDLFGDQKELIYSATLEEILNGEVDIKVCQDRLEKYLEQESLSFPPRLASFVAKPESAKRGVSVLSPGTATGTLVARENLHTVPGPKILYTEILTPNLTEYFDQIEGIVTREGGLLSHLAIVAREQGLPVVQTFKPVQLDKLVTIKELDLIFEPSS